MLFREKIIINENQMGYLFKNGEFCELLKAGKYHTSGDSHIETAELAQPLSSAYCTLGTLLKDKNIQSKTVTVEVNDGELAFHYVNGRFYEALESGTYAYWNIYDKHEFTKIDISSPESSEQIPAAIFGKIPESLYTKISVGEFERAALFFDRKFVRLLDSGTYFFWNCGTNITAISADTRLKQMNITGQEILTKDKVGLRINCICNYRITDYIKVFTEIVSCEELLYTAAQMALRSYIGKYSIDEILENKEQMSQYILESLKSKEKELFIEITDAGVKDIILPGEIRDIMNTVLIAEKRAQANVITRREEVASTRSLLNTAKLMDENRTLYRLKELEYLERICSNIDNLTFNGGDILNQIVSAINSRGKDNIR